MKYIETVDGQRDYILQHTSDVTYQCVSRQTQLLRKNKADVEPLVVSQLIQKSLFQQNQRLMLANKALKKLNIRANNQKAVQFEPTNNVPDSPLKKLKISTGTTTPKSKVRKSSSIVKSNSVGTSTSSSSAQLTNSASVPKKSEAFPQALSKAKVLD